MILSKAVGRWADGTNQPAAQIGLPTYPIVKRFQNWIEEKTINGEIPPDGVSPSICKGDRARAAPILVIGFGAKRGHLELMLAFNDDDDPKLAPDRDGVLESAFDLFRQCGSSDVVIIRRTAEQKIPHATADPESAEPGLLELAHNAD